MLSGWEYHRQLSLFYPYSVLFQNLQLFFQMTYSYNLRRWWLLQVQSYFRDIIDYAQIRSIFLIIYSWRFLQAITLKILVRNFDAKCIKFEQIESFSAIYNMPDSRHCLTVTRDHWGVSLYNCLLFLAHMGSSPLVYRLHTQDIAPQFSNVMARKVFSSKESKRYFLLGIVNDIPKVSVNLQ